MSETLGAGDPLKQYYVYILANKQRGTLYIGVTNNLIRRMFEHKEGLNDGFNKKYEVHILVHYEMGFDIEGAIKREKQLKRWKRVWKVKLVESANPNWKDLSDAFW